MGVLTQAWRAQTLCQSSWLLTARVVGVVIPLALPFSMVENDAPAAIAATAQRLMPENKRKREGRTTAYWRIKLVVAPPPDWKPDLVAVAVTV